MEKLLSCLTSAPSICQNVMFFEKKTFLNVGLKLLYLGTFGQELKKATALWYCTPAVPNFSTLKMFSKNKNP